MQFDPRREGDFLGLHLQGREGTTELAALNEISISRGERGLRRLLRGWQTWGGGGSGHWRGSEVMERHGAHLLSLHSGSGTLVLSLVPGSGHNETVVLVRTELVVLV